MTVLPVKMIESLSSTSTPAEFKSRVFDAVGNLKGVEVMFNMVLLAIYIRPEMTPGRIIRPGSNVQEDVWQGKAGLVLKCGPYAFEDDGEYQFKGQRVDPGDWCAFKVGDAWSLNINNVPCRLVRDASIRLKLADPNIVF